MRLASCKSLGMIVTRRACIAHRLQSSNKCTKKSSVASCNASRLSAVYRRGSGESSFEISRTWRRDEAIASGQSSVRARRVDARSWRGQTTHQSRERHLPDQQIRRLLKPPNLLERQRPRTIASLLLIQLCERARGRRFAVSTTLIRFARVFARSPRVPATRARSHPRESQPRASRRIQKRNPSSRVPLARVRVHPRPRRPSNASTHRVSRRHPRPIIAVSAPARARTTRARQRPFSNSSAHRARIHRARRLSVPSARAERVHASPTPSITVSRTLNRLPCSRRAMPRARPALASVRTAFVDALRRVNASTRPRAR